MAFNFLLLNPYSEELKCNLCKNFLSHFPIFTCDNENICGRCTLPLNKSFFRNNLYEVVAHFLKFPCRYKDGGCVKELLPKDIPQHEKTCPYRTIPCPVADFLVCEWKGSRHQLLQHCKDDHLSRFLEENDFAVSLNQNVESFIFLEQGNLLFIAKYMFDCTTKIFQCAVYCLEDETDVTQFPCRLSFTNANRSVLVQFLPTHYKNISFIDISVDQLRSRNDNLPSAVWANISLEGIADNADKQNLKILQSLHCMKCSKCSVFILPPIYQCAVKQVMLCSQCFKNHVLYCSNCGDQNNFSLRNVGLEELAFLLDYPCKNRKNGCTIVAKASEIMQHQNVCVFREIKCPFHEYVTCFHKGMIQDMLFHFTKDHKNHVINNNSEISLKLSTNTTYCGIIQFLNSLFRIVFVKNHKYYRWVVQIIGNFEKDIYYTIELIDELSGGKRKLVATAPCCQLTEKKILFLNNNHCLFYLDQVKLFMRKDYQLKFRVNIFNTL